MKREVAEASGRRAEGIAAAYLTGKGWTILATRVRTPAGEVDLVARRPGLVAFVEVKARATASALDTALDRAKLVPVVAAAEALIDRYAQPGDDIRIDAILIAPGRTPRHLEHVWQGLRKALSRCGRGLGEAFFAGDAGRRSLTLSSPDRSREWGSGLKLRPLSPHLRPLRADSIQFIIAAGAGVVGAFLQREQIDELADE